MRWFGGLEPIPGRGVPVLAPPDGARLLWSGMRPLWAVGDWPDHEVRVAAIDGRRLAVLGPCGATHADLERALIAFRQGRPALHDWSGSYTVVIADEVSKTILTDLAWACPVYTTRTAEGMVYASSAVPLADLTGWRVDQAWLAGSLLCRSAPEVVAGRSPFAGVRTVPPAHALILTGHTQRLEVIWSPTCDHVLDEAAPALREALVGGVRVRVGNAARPTADCSGGLDSTSLTFLAAASLSPGRRLPAITMYPAGVDDGADLACARAAVFADERIDHYTMPLGEDTAPYTAVTATPLTDEPAPSTSTIARFGAELALLRELGSDCHLTGDGGDAVLAAPPSYLADLARASRLRRLWWDCTAWARLRNRSSLTLARAAVRSAHTNPKTALYALADTLAAPEAALVEPSAWERLIAWYPDRPPAGWYPRTARHLVAELVGSAAEGAATGPLGCGDRAGLVAVQSNGRTTRADVQLAEGLGVPLHNPYLDSAVVRACLSVPATARTSPSVAKPLLSRALTGLVPASVLQRSTKGDFTADDYLGIRANAAALHQLFHEPRLADLGLIEPCPMHRIIDRAAAGLQVPLAAFEQVVAAEVWLRNVPAAPPTGWQRTAARGADR
ncbi:MAG: albusnodin/ikarugamycin family macrolactam cyclase [Egibacteraceae bacterium]